MKKRDENVILDICEYLLILEYDFNVILCFMRI